MKGEYFDSRVCANESEASGATTAKKKRKRDGVIDLSLIVLRNLREREPLKVQAVMIF
jgi:hypothetical protein